MFRWMEVYPKKMNGIRQVMRMAHDAVYRQFLSGYTPSNEKLLLSFL